MHVVLPTCVPTYLQACQPDRIEDKKARFFKGLKYGGGMSAILWVYFEELLIWSKDFSHICAYALVGRTHTHTPSYKRPKFELLENYSMWARKIYSLRRRRRSEWDQIRFVKLVLSQTLAAGRVWVAATGATPNSPLGKLYEQPIAVECLPLCMNLYRSLVLHWQDW